MTRIAHRLLVAAAVAATAASWLVLDSLPGPQRLWAVILLVPLPLLMIQQARHLERTGPIPRQAAYASTIASLWVLLIATLAIMRGAGITADRIALHAVQPLPLGAWSTVLTLGAVALLFLFRALGVREGDTVRWLMPVSPAERRLFVIVSISAGVCEEVIFRGFLLHALSDAGAADIVAVGLSSIAFGVLHAYQHPAGALRAALLGALLALPVVLGYGLLPAIIAHTLLDILSGLWLSRYLLR